MIAPRGFDFTRWHWTLDANITLCGRLIIIGRDNVPLFPETDDLSDVVDCKICRRRLTLLQADAAINNQIKGQAVAAAPLKPGR